MRNLVICCVLVGLGGACGSDMAPSTQQNPGTGAVPGETPGATAQPSDTASGSAPGADGGTASAGSTTAGSSTPGSSPGSKPAEDKPVEPLQGPTEFVSADDGSNGSSNAETGAAGAAATAPVAAPNAMTADAASARSVERGDIYRVLGDHRIVNLNAYRGLQIIDVSDVSAPRIEGHLAMTGDPVEMYVVDARVFVLLNNWQGYYGSRDDVRIESVRGGLLVSVDISDRAHPVLLDRTSMRGSISTSRLTQGDGQTALYVAATNYNDTAEAVVKSFSVSDGKFTPKTELNLGGYVQDIAATPDVLMVASMDYTRDQNRSQVSLIDISRPDGTMERGGTVLAQGIVRNKFNMDVYNGILRVVSGASWNGGTRNQLETFDLGDLKNPELLDRCTFGARAPNGQNEMLFATAFVENRAFFVTYYRVDPFHAFSIDDSGRCQEHSEFIVSGWNDFLRPTLSDTRLVGIGHNDQNNARKLSVSLYDAVNLSNRNPLLARADIDLSGSYSEATWDDRGFSVLEDAVSVDAADGSNETGLVLLPYQGWDQKAQRQVAEVQIFTFSNHTLTKRGSMNHGTSVRRSFVADASVAANLSEDQLSLFDVADPNLPKELGRVEIAPNYARVFIVGDYVARVKEPPYSYNYFGPAAATTSPPSAEVQIVERAADPDAAPAIASFEVTAGADLVQVGSLLVSLYSYANGTATNSPTYKTQINVFDLSDPTQPKQRGSLETDRLQLGYGYGPRPFLGVVDCIDCGIWPYRAGLQRYAVGQAIAFASMQAHQENLGRVRECVTHPYYAQVTEQCPARYFTGSRICTSVAGGEERCRGEILECDDSGACEPASDPTLVTQQNCSEFDQQRYWQSYALDTLDLRDPDAPTLAERVNLPDQEQASSIVAAGNTLFVNHSVPYAIKNSALNHLKRYVRVLDFSDPQRPNIGDAINVPGDVIAVDGSTVFTRDQVWDQSQSRTQLARLTISDNLAYLQASLLFTDRNVDAVVLDTTGHVFVSNNTWATVRGPCINSFETPQYNLTILDAKTLEVSSETAIDQWGTLVDVEQGRALFQVSGGLMLFDVTDPAHPAAQAYFPTQSWPSEILFDASDILFAGGMYGVYRFDSDVFNLLTK